MRFLLLLPVALVVLVLFWTARLVEAMCSEEWRWMALLASCYALMAVPLLFWNVVAGAWTVVLVKAWRARG